MWIVLLLMEVLRREAAVPARAIQGLAHTHEIRAAERRGVRRKRGATRAPVGSGCGACVCWKDSAAAAGACACWNEACTCWGCGAQEVVCVCCECACASGSGARADIESA